MSIVSSYSNYFPMPKRGMADTSSSVIAFSLVDEPGYSVCACDRSCEFEEIAFVGTSDGAWWKNDKKRFIRSKRFASDTIVFSLRKNDAQVAVLNSSTYGDYFDFGSSQLINPDYKCFIINWKLVKQAFGYGKYVVRTVHTSLGTIRTYDSYKFHVREYSDAVANGTVRIETYQTGVLMNGFDYTGINLYQSLRIQGFFGDKKPEYELNYYQDTERFDKQIQAKVRDIYRLETQPLPSSVYNVLNYDDILANDIYITDYNVKNKERYWRLNVVFDGLPEMENYARSKKSDFVYQFKNKQDNQIKRNIDGDFGLMPLQPNTTSTLTCADAELTVNGDAFTSIPSGNAYDLIVKDEDGAQVGSKIGDEWIVPKGIVPAGVLFKWPTGSQYTSFRTGDEGWRMQNGYFDYTPPVNPKTIAEIDSSIGQNGWLRLKNPLVVGGVSSVIRFVGINGLQDWPATNNLDKITIDKLTGIGIYRIEADVDPVKTWNNSIDGALAHSVVVDGVTYSDFYLISLEEMLLMFYHKSEQASGHLEDIISVGAPDIYVKVGSTSESWTSTTVANSAGANAYSRGWNPEAYVRGAGKTATFMPFYIFDARSLITAP
jgi:hypothetical protein